METEKKKARCPWLAADCVDGCGYHDEDGDCTFWNEEVDGRMPLNPHAWWIRQLQSLDEELGAAS